MDPTRPDALTRALHDRRSRRDALRLLGGGAVGALASGARRDAAEAAVTRLPALPKGWTHLAGTTTGLLFYRRKALPTGYRGTSGTFVDGRFEAAVTLDTYGKWGTIVGASRSLLFHSDTTGRLTTGYLDAAGRPVFPPDAGVQTWGTKWRFYPGTRSGRLAGWSFSDLVSERLLPYALTADGHTARGRFFAAAVGDGWTRAAGAGYNAYLLYKGTTGEALTGRVESRLGADGLTEYVWVTQARYAFASGWTHVAGTFNGGLFFYKQADGFAATGVLDADGDYAQTANLQFAPGFTHVVGAGSRGVLLYNAATGKGVGGYLAAGVWTRTTVYG